MLHVIVWQARWENKGQVILQQTHKHTFIVAAAIEQDTSVSPEGRLCSVSAPDISILGCMLKVSDGAACCKALGCIGCPDCMAPRLCGSRDFADFCCLAASAFLLSTNAWTVASSCLRIFLACFSESALTLSSRGPFAVLSWMSKQSLLPGFCVRKVDGSHLTITSKGNLSRCCKCQESVQNRMPVK